MIKVQSFTFSPIQENTYVLYNEKNDAIIIDPGCYTNAERTQLKTFIEAQALRPVMLVNTHCHLDHVFGNKWVADTWQLIPQIHPLEERMHQLAPASGQLWGLPFEPYEGPFGYINEQTGLRLGEDSFEVLLAPGHSPGSLCFYHAGQQLLIAGDVLFYESIGRTDLPGGSLEQLLQSIRTKLFPLPDDTVVYPGHGPATTIGHEKRRNPFLQGA